MEPTAYSLRCASASGSGSCLALDLKIKIHFPDLLSKQQRPSFTCKVDHPLE
jgi:hypothetical protein